MKPLPRRSLEETVLWIAVIVAWGVALLGLLGPKLGGATPGPQGLLGFAVEVCAAQSVLIGVLAMAALCGALLRHHRWPAFALAPIALLLLGPELLSIAWPRAAPLPGESAPLRVASVNLQGENSSDPRMEGSLREMNADVLVLVEFTRSWAERLEAWFPEDYPHRWLAAAPPEPGLSMEGLRIAIWSRLPAAGEPEVRILRRANAQIRVPLLWRGRAFALYGIHPWKPYPLRSYRGAWSERRELLEWIGAERLPTLVAGDFNASPRSAFLERLRRLGLTVAAEATRGRAPATWPMQPTLLAPFRVAIDHVLNSEAFLPVGFRRGPPTLSDHAPVLAEFQWRDG